MNLQSTITVAPHEVDERLDKLLVLRYPEQSRSYFQSLIEGGHVTVNGKRVKKRYKPQAADQVAIDFVLTAEISLEPEAIPLDILYEDEHLIAVNKPPGLVVHPGPGNWSGTFVNALLYHCKQLEETGDPLRPGIVHRLDKNTSGVLLAAKTQRCHHKLVELFAQRRIKKVYLAITLGKPGEQRIDLPIGRHPTQRKLMTVREGGKSAVTHCKTLAYDGQLAIVELLLETGRTHQIRVHLKHLNCPILGDDTYGKLSSNQKYGAKRSLLHAHTLSFEHPLTQESLELKAPVPEDMRTFMDRIVE